MAGAKAIRNMPKKVNKSKSKGKYTAIKKGKPNLFNTSGELAKGLGKNIKGSIANDLGKSASKVDGWDIAGSVGKHAARGAVWGGVAGGISSSAQGGSFWSGAKEGAFKGAVGWSGYKTLRRGTGGKGPFLGKGLKNEWSKAESRVSKQVVKLEELGRTTKINKGVNGLQ